MDRDSEAKDYDDYKLEDFLAGEAVEPSADDLRPDESPDASEAPAIEADVLGVDLEFSQQATPLRVVGAWAVSAVCNKPSYWVGFARSMNLNRIDLMINGMGRDTGCPAFTSPDARKLGVFAEGCRRAGIELHLTSWIRPCKAFIADAAATLLPVMRDQGIASLMWDAEEPWTRWRGDLSFADAATMVGDRFHDVQMGVTAIVFARAERLQELIARSAHLIPQAYATAPKYADPGALVRTARRQWLQKFQRAPNIMGLAAWKQGADPVPRMRSAIAGVAACGVDTVIYWSLGWLNQKQNAPLARFVASLRG